MLKWSESTSGLKWLFYSVPCYEESAPVGAYLPYCERLTWLCQHPDPAVDLYVNADKVAVRDYTVVSNPEFVAVGVPKDFELKLGQSENDVFLFALGLSRWDTDSSRIATFLTPSDAQSATFCKEAKQDRFELGQREPIYEPFLESLKQAIMLRHAATP
jgi:hypothetical protein